MSEDVCAVGIESKKLSDIHSPVMTSKLCVSQKLLSSPFHIHNLDGSCYLLLKKNWHKFIYFFLVLTHKQQS